MTISTTLRSVLQNKSKGKDGQAGPICLVPSFKLLNCHWRYALKRANAPRR